MLDCLTVGGGPAGLVAALYLRRYHRRTCVFDAGESRAALPESHNYPGFNGIGGFRRERKSLCCFEPKELVGLEQWGLNLAFAFLSRGLEALGTHWYPAGSSIH